MYKYKSKQISFEDFDQPIGLQMNPDNRWVKRASLIPWEEIEEKYAKLFPSKEGNIAKPLRLALGALIIKQEYGYSDEEVAAQIRENPYLQYFVGMPGYRDEQPFDPSLMVHFRKRLTPEILGEINDQIIKQAQVRKTSEDDEKSNTNKDGDGGGKGNSGTLILDATCIPTDIAYPQDIELLNKARKKLEQLIDGLHEQSGGEKPRTYRKKAHKDYLAFAKTRRRNARQRRKAIGKQLNYIRRNLGYIDKMAEKLELSAKQKHIIGVITELFNQQNYMHKNRINRVENRIVSLHEPFIRPIVRGKAKAPTEFGPKVEISMENGFTRIERYSYDAFNESTGFIASIERYKERNGKYPERVLVDKLYRTRENIRYCKERGIRLSGPSLGRPGKNAERDRKTEYQDMRDRNPIEGKLGQGKRAYGLDCIYERLPETIYAAVAVSIIVMNLHKILLPFLLVVIFFLFLANISHYFKNYNVLAVC